MVDEYAIEYLRPDGWWEAGRGWETREHAKEDAEDHFKDDDVTKWRVVKVTTKKPTKKRKR